MMSMGIAKTPFVNGTFVVLLTQITADSGAVADTAALAAHFSGAQASAGIATFSADDS
jgi:hypothetical protein